MATSYPAFARAIAAAAPIPFAAPVTRAALRVDAIASPWCRGVLLAAAHDCQEIATPEGAGNPRNALRKHRGDQETCRKSGSAGQNRCGYRDFVAIDGDHLLRGEQRARQGRPRD